MEICRQIVSYPYIKYVAKITHTTPRKPTVFEWLCLEVLTKAKGSAFENENLLSLFQNYFQVQNAQALLPSVLRRLYDLGEIQGDFDDSMDLEKCNASDIEILPLGREMHAKGLLPGDPATEQLDVLYDFADKKLVWEHKKLKLTERANGIDAHGKTDEDVYFSEKEIRKHLDAQKNQADKTESKDKKKAVKLDWIKANTEIISIEREREDRLFNNIERGVHLRGDATWHIEDNNSVELEKISLQKFADECNVPENFPNYPLSNMSDIDKEVRQFIMPSDLTRRIKQDVERYKICAVDSYYFDNFSGETADENETKNQKSGAAQKNKAVSVVLLSNAAKLERQIAGGKLILAIPEKFLPQECVFAAENFSLNCEKFLAKAGDISKELTLAYLPKNNAVDFNKLILNAVEQYCNELPALLFALNEIAGENGKDNIAAYLDAKLKPYGIEKKSEIVEELNSLSDALYGKRFFADEKTAALLIDKKTFVSRLVNVSDVCKIIEEYAKIPAVKKYAWNYFLEEVLRDAPQTDSLDEIANLFTLMRQTPNALGLLDNKGLLAKLYSEKALKSLVEKYFADSTINGKAAVCDLERRVATLAEWHKKIIEFYEKKDDKKLNDAVNEWNQNIHNFDKRYGHKNLFKVYDSHMKEMRQTLSAAKGGANKTNINDGGKK